MHIILNVNFNPLWARDKHPVDNGQLVNRSRRYMRTLVSKKRESEAPLLHPLSPTGGPPRANLGFGGFLLHVEVRAHDPERRADCSTDQTFLILPGFFSGSEILYLRRFLLCHLVFLDSLRLQPFCNNIFHFNTSEVFRFTNLKTVRSSLLVIYIYSSFASKIVKLLFLGMLVGMCPNTVL